MLCPPNIILVSLKTYFPIRNVSDELKDTCEISVQNNDPTFEEEYIFKYDALPESNVNFNR